MNTIPKFYLTYTYTLNISKLGHARKMHFYSIQQNLKNGQQTKKNEKAEYVHIKHWRLTELVIFMDGCNAVKLWEQHKFHENIINEHPIYSHVKIWM